MNEELRQDIEQHISELPQEVRDMLASVDLDTELAKIPEAEPLQDVQKKQIKNEVMKVLLGLSAPFEMTTLIKVNAEIARDRAEAIAKQMQQNVLAPNAETLALIFELPDVTEENKEHHPTINDGIAPHHHDSYREPVEETGAQNTINPPIAPAPKEQVPQPPHQSIQSEAKNQSTQETQSQNDPLDTFKQKMQAPIHAQTKEEVISDKQKTPDTPEPAAKERIAKDPYKESIE